MNPDVAIIYTQLFLFFFALFLMMEGAIWLEHHYGRQIKRIWDFIKPW